MLAKIYGVFTIKTNVFKSVDVIVMQNTVQVENQLNPQMKFDLKGSTKGRYQKFSRKDHLWWQKDQLGHPSVMKDNNYLQIDHDYNYNLIDMEEEQKIVYKKMLTQDSMFLRIHNLIDYSLLLVVESSYIKP